MKMVMSKLASSLLFASIALLLSQNLTISGMSIAFDEQKNYYSPYSNPQTPPISPSYTPPRVSGKTPSTPSKPPQNCGNPPLVPTPSKGGGYYYPAPHDPTPTPSTPSSPGGGYYYPPPHDPTPTPSTPSSPGGAYYYPPPHDPTPTPSTPSSPGGGYYYPPPHDPTPTPSTPSSPGEGYYYPPPAGGGLTTPISLTPPTTPSAPTLTPPFLPDPNSPFIGTINYWRTHPVVIWGLLGWWGTLGSAFGTATPFPGFGPSLPLPQALSNTRTDGIGALYREGTASFLNSMLNNRFPFTTNQVRESFVAALASNKAAAAQAQAFKKANEGMLKPRA